MNSKMKTNSMRYGLGAGLLLCTAVAASAAGNSLVTFSVDMTAAIQNSAFTPATSHVFARGTFNGWSLGAYYDTTGSSQLTNNPAAVGLASNIYTGTFADTNDNNGSNLQYKYYIDTGGNWESVNNRTFGLPTANGGHLVLPTYYFNDVAPTGLTPVTDSITFQVDLTQQIAVGNFIQGASTVFARGSYNGWGAGTAMTNDPAGPNTNLYSITVSHTGLPDSPQFYKYYIDTGTLWENSPPMLNADGSGNRVYNLLETDGALVLPGVYFNDQVPVPPVTNNVTFRVDMTFQIALGRFSPPPNGSDYVEAKGSFNAWGDGFFLTNNPAAVGQESNVFSGVWTFVGNPNTGIPYKFYSSSGGWESPLSTGGNNRTFNLLSTNGDLVLPDVFFNDLQLGDITPTNTVVTFTVDMTSAVGTDAHVFDPSTDGVYLNGDFQPGGWLPWDLIGGLQNYPLTNYPVGSKLYQIQLEIPAGKSLALTYKCGINGVDDEAGFAQNHVRYIRTAGNYAFPVDKFGNQYSEPATGNVAITAPSGGHAVVAWLGHPGIYLQTRSSLTSGSWQDLPWTDGTSWASGVSSTNGFVSTTNYPTSGGQTFFRWVKPQSAPAP